MLYFGVLRELMGCPREWVEMDDGASVRDLVARVRGEREDGVWGVMAVAVNREYAGLGTVLRDGDEVALLPPVSGGWDGGGSGVLGEPTHRDEAAMNGAREIGEGLDAD